MSIQVKDFMSTPVITALGENTVLEIRTLMKDKGIHAVPIITCSKYPADDEMTIRGIVTLTDFSKEIHDGATVEDVMTSSSVHVVHTSSSVQAAAKMMLKHDIHHMVAMDDGKIMGMISSLDFVSLVAEHGLG